MKILCTKEEYTAMIRNCAFTYQDNECVNCVMHAAIELCDCDKLAYICEIIPSDGGTGEWQQGNGTTG